MAEDKVIYFVRHGVTDWNKEGRLQGGSDIALSKQGMEQARRVAVRLENIPTQVIYSSPLSRAVQTAEIMAAGKREVICWQELSEKNFGVWEGKTINEIMEQFPDDFANWMHHLPAKIKHAETEEECFRRAATVTQRLKELNDRGIIVVTHGVILRFILISLLGIETKTLLANCPSVNCSVTAVKIDEKGKATLLFLNDSIHLVLQADSETKLHQKIRAIPPFSQQ